MNLTFMNLDATKTIPDGNWEVIIIKCFRTY